VNWWRSSTPTAAGLVRVPAWISCGTLFSPLLPFPSSPETPAGFVRFGSFHDSAWERYSLISEAVCACPQVGMAVVALVVIPTGRQTRRRNPKMAAFLPR
jgi:hypothetical protein